jgi:hypothetical protein
MISEKNKKPSVADVEHTLARCQCALEAAPTAAKKREWQARINFLNRLRARLARADISTGDEDG